MSAKRFSGTAAAVTTGATLPILTLNTQASAPTARPEIYDIVIGSEATPADQAGKYDLIRVTNAGATGTAAIGPNALDPAYPASVAQLFQGTYATAPAATANSTLLRISLNQRATFRWVAAPESGLIVPATANNGIELQSVASTGSPVVDSTFLWLE